MSGFTPGPWVASHNGVFWEFGQEGTIHNLGDVCSTGHFEKKSGYGSEPDDLPVFSGTAEANAHLIAAAPELYAACEEFIRKCDNGEARSKRSYAEMRAALRKARGEDQ